MKFDLAISGDAELERRFLTADSRLRRYVRETLDLYGRQIQSQAQALVPKRSGKLATSIKAKSWENATSVREYVKPRRFYAHIIEGGVEDKEITVSGYTRRTKAGTLKGKLPSKSGRLTTRTVAQGVSFIAGYQRRHHLAAHPFMNPAWEANKGSLEADLKAALVRAMSEDA